MLPSETMIWQPEFTDKTLSRKPGAVHSGGFYPPPHPVVSPHESDRRLFSQPHWVSGCALLLYSLHSCPSIGI
ncbi:hypothetical protein A0V00_09440 [Shigella dysenteriae]|nr:hypothetical protein A0V00_09440 [Shigella dysenteriae]